MIFTITTFNYKKESYHTFSALATLYPTSIQVAMNKDLALNRPT